MTILLARTLPTWADAPADFRKFDRNLIEIPRYADIEHSMSRHAQTVIADLQQGKLTKAQAMGRFKDALITHETEAFVAGRRARGDLRDHLTDAEERMLTGRHSRNMRYFSGFCDDVLEGEGRMPYPRRAEAYAKSLWSLYSRGETSDWSDPTATGKRYGWALDPEAEHCRSCLKNAAESRERGGFTWDELTERGWPGEKTDCLYECRCHVYEITPPKSSTTRDDLPSPAESPVAPADQPAETPQLGLEILQQQLGGPELPRPLPAAGVPFVRVEPETVRVSVAAAGDQPAKDSLLRSLPLLQSVLATPQTVLDAGDTRIYTLGGLGAAITRRDDGLWWLALFMLAPVQSSKEGR